MKHFEVKYPLPMIQKYCGQVSSPKTMIDLARQGFDKPYSWHIPDSCSFSFSFPWQTNIGAFTLFVFFFLLSIARTTKASSTCVPAKPFLVRQSSPHTQTACLVVTTGQPSLTANASNLRGRREDQHTKPRSSACRRSGDKQRRKRFCLRLPDHRRQTRNDETARPSHG